MAALARIVIGCYEEMIVCYDLVRASDEKDNDSASEDVDNVENGKKADSNSLARTDSNAASKLELKLSFTDHPHSGSVRCITASKGERGRLRSYSSMFCGDIDRFGLAV